MCVNLAYFVVLFNKSLEANSFLNKGPRLIIKYIFSSFQLMRSCSPGLAVPNFRASGLKALEFDYNLVTFLDCHHLIDRCSGLTSYSSACG